MCFYYYFLSLFCSCVLCLFHLNFCEDSNELRFSCAFHTIVTKFVSLQMGFFVAIFSYSFLLGILYFGASLCPLFIKHKIFACVHTEHFCLICFVSHSLYFHSLLLHRAPCFSCDLSAYIYIYIWFFWFVRSSVELSFVCYLAVGSCSNRVCLSVCLSKPPSILVCFFYFII